VATFFESAQAGRRLRINARRQLGDDGCTRDYVFVSDVVRANLLALSGAITDRVLNVGTGAATSTRALAASISRSVGRELLLEFAAPRPGDLERSVLDPARAEHYLTSLTPLGLGLEQTHDFYAARAA
jgi:UDP-glucose 4-epimerase